MIYPNISILTPTFNRKRFLPLMINNIINFDYSKDKIEWNILDSFIYQNKSGEKLFKNKDEIDKLEDLLKIRINYNYYDKPLSIGQKRNILSEMSCHDILINMDDDDFYLPSYLKHSVEVLLNDNKDVVGCLDMLFVYPEKEFKTSYIKCVQNYKLYDESTLCMRKKHWRKYKYIDTSRGEGNKIGNNTSKCGITKVNNCVISTCWSENTINKDYFLRYPIILKDIDLKILKSIFKELVKMEDTIKEEKKETIEIPKELLHNIRNLITVTNERVNWKIEELLPVGIMIKQIDELLKDH